MHHPLIHPVSKEGQDVFKSENIRPMSERILMVKVTPRSGRDEVIKFEDEVLHVRLTAAPIQGKANQACIILISKLLNVAKSRICRQAAINRGLRSL